MCEVYLLLGRKTHYAFIQR